MREKFLEILSTYNSAKTDNEVRSQVKDIFSEIVSEIENTPPIISRRYLVVKYGMGIGRIALVPWVAIMDKRETTTPQKGVYCVYLFKGDMSGVFLTFNQGVGGQRGARAPL